MKLFLRPNQQSCQHFYGNSMALRALLFSTQAALTSAITPLKRMIMRPEDPKASVVPILENWVQQGNEIEHSQLHKIIRKLHNLNRFNHALQISQWMGDKGGYELSAADFATQLELTSRVGGIEQVETYFDAIPYNLRGYEVYWSLLRSYANLGSFGHGGCLGKGEATVQKLRELGFVRDASAYNVMLSFYYKIREYDKMNIIAEEMREKGIDFNRITYSLLLKGNGDYQSIKKMEEVLAELEADPLVKIDWYHYFLAAEGYRNSEEVKKASAMLRKSEESIEGNLNWHTFESLVTFHGEVGTRADVHRLWSLYKPKKGFYHRAYYRTLCSLTELHDADGATRIWEEWLSKYSRIPKATIAAMKDTWEKEVYSEIPVLLIGGHGDNLNAEKAEAIVSRLRETGIEPGADTLFRLAEVYCECREFDNAVETLMKAISVCKPGWEPDWYVFELCFDHLDRQGDGGCVEREELSKMLQAKSVCSKGRALQEAWKMCLTKVKWFIEPPMIH